jgi:hypothetical protein
MPLTKLWPRVGVDLIKRVISDCWRGFRGDDPGWARFDQCQQCLTWLIRSLALMMLIKNLGRHRVEGASWVVITKPMFWIFLLSYSCWWCVNLNIRLACFGDASLVVSRIVFLLFFMRLPSCSDSAGEGKHNELGSHFRSCMPRTYQCPMHLVFDHGLPSCSD